MPARLIERRHGEYAIITDPGRIDLVAVHRYLSEESYWAADRSSEIQRRAIEHSHLVVGADDDAGDQGGFARMVTDLATFAWLADVFVLPAARGRGLGTALVETIVEHPDVADVSWQVLATNDVHGLYARFGCTPSTSPRNWVHRRVAT